MIKANELRIGNLVHTNFEREKQITDIKPIDFRENYLNLYDPIPLTEEWLLKFGFEKENILSDGTISFKFNPYFYFNPLKKEGYICIHTPPIKYVHQLQNLYFSLTGEELRSKIN